MFGPNSTRRRWIIQTAFYVKGIFSKCPVFFQPLRSSGQLRNESNVCTSTQPEDRRRDAPGCGMPILPRSDSLHRPAAHAHAVRRTTCKQDTKGGGKHAGCSIAHCEASQGELNIDCPSKALHVAFVWQNKKARQGRDKGLRQHLNAG